MDSVAYHQDKIMFTLFRQPFSAQANKLVPNECKPPTPITKMPITILNQIIGFVCTYQVG